MSVIQQVYLPDAKYSIYIKGIKPDKERDMFVTDNYDIPTYFITKFLEENDCLVEQDDKVYVAFKEVVFKSNY